MFRFRKDPKLNYAGDHPDEFEKAQKAIKAIKEKEKSDEIDPRTAEKRIEKIYNAARMHDDCLSLYDKIPPETRGYECADSYRYLLKQLNGSSTHSSDIDRTIKSTVKYVNICEQRNERPLLREAKEAIKVLKDLNTNNPLETKNRAELAKEIDTKRNNYKLCEIWSGVKNSYIKNYDLENRCTQEERELFEALNKASFQKP